MLIDRRTVLKSAIFSSAVSTLSSCQQHVTHSRPSVSAMGTSSDGSCFVNALFLGGFFVKFQQTQILVKAPAVSIHKYAFGSQGFLTEVYNSQSRPVIGTPPSADVSVDMDLTTLISGLTPGSINSFADYPMIPQFSATDTKVGNMNGRYRWQIVLPFPEEIIPLRLGKLADFDRVTRNGSKVKESVMNLCSKKGNDKLALAICLRYRRQPEFCSGYPPAITYTFHADHVCEPSTEEINLTLKQMGTIFEHPENFDLQATDADAPVVKRDKDKGDKGITEDDEKSLAEILSAVPTAAIKCLHSGPELTKVKSCIAIIAGGQPTP